MTRQPADKPQMFLVPELTEGVTRKVEPGRPKKLVLPAIPKEILEGMSQLEQEWFYFFIDAIKKEIPDLSPLEELEGVMAAFDLVNTLRLQCQQLTAKELVTMSRQHPAVQCRAWIDQIKKNRSGKPQSASDEKDMVKSFFGMG